MTDGETLVEAKHCSPHFYKSTEHVSTWQPRGRLHPSVALARYGMPDLTGARVHGQNPTVPYRVSAAREGLPAVAWMETSHGSLRTTAPPHVMLSKVYL